jgi:hypothetical protein
MKDAGMRVIPYINGQLFDILLPKYKTDKAAQFAAKLSPKTMKTEGRQPNLTLNTRIFDHISDVVMCPATPPHQHAFSPFSVAGGGVHG